MRQIYLILNLGAKYKIVVAIVMGTLSVWDISSNYQECTYKYIFFAASMFTCMF